MRDLYEKYAGVEIQTDSEICSTVFKGIICGYTDSALVMAVTEYISGKWEDGWHIEDFECVTHNRNKLGYWHVERSELSKLD